MFTKILVPLDGSAFAEGALSAAEALAQSTGADVALVRVVELVAPGEREPGVISYLDEHRIAAAQDYISGVAARLRLGRPVSAEAYLAADVPAGILARARDAGVDVIVMTSHGASGPVGSALGSVAAVLVRESTCPVLVIGPRAAGADTREPAAARAPGRD